MVREHQMIVSDEANSGFLGGLRWQPGRDAIIAFISYLLVVGGLYLAFQVFTIDRVAANFITFGPITLALLGVGIPVGYAVFFHGRGIQVLGIRRENLIASIGLGLLLAWDTYSNTVANLELPAGRSMVPLIAMVLAVGLFEAIFFRGWLQMTFERSFGMVPGLILAAACYSLYHVGYGMEAGEMLFLFGLGLTFGAFFRLTKNIFVLWPFYTPMGSLYTNVSEGLSLPFEATYGFVLTLVLMLGLIIVGQRVASRQSSSNSATRAA